MNILLNIWIIVLSLSLMAHSVSIVVTLTAAAAAIKVIVTATNTETQWHDTTTQNALSFVAYFIFFFIHLLARMHSRLYVRKFSLPFLESISAYLRQAKYSLLSSTTTLTPLICPISYP